MFSKVKLYCMFMDCTCVYKIISIHNGTIKNKLIWTTKCTAKKKRLNTGLNFNIVNEVRQHRSLLTKIYMYIPRPEKRTTTTWHLQNTD